MMGVRPGEVSARTEPYGGPILTAGGLLVLATCTIFAAAGPHGESGEWLGTLAIVGATALWLLLMLPLFPRRRRHPVLVLVFYAGFLAGCWLLTSRNDSFTTLSSLGYPFGFVLFSARWSIFAVTATAITPMLAKGGFGPDTHTPAWVPVLSIVGPMLYAAWFVGAENEKRHKANTALTESNGKLENALRENAGLQAQLLTQAREAGVLDERQRLAGEIHDTLAQGLAGIVTQLQAAERAEHDPVRHRQHLAHVHSLAKDSLSEARRSVQALRPEPLAESRLPEAVAELARRFTETSGVRVRTETVGDARPLLPELEVTLYRVAQEALANAGKHAHASAVGLTLSYSDDVVMLDVLDDGVGFRTDGPREEPADGSGFGLRAMAQRVQRIAGTLEIESAPGRGTAINAQVPAIPAESGSE
ncbi:sensor histidine kinase [Amycolatopsis sp. H20-H5]|uniref:sensor histidine kinase n=1 Tax=Amycolatopsis sp. H20-H5 TaxID=3046309 RepID=UPI002DB80DC0|nr:sensor histidine kinase [Amycolatopsis sp. H20-H5]MEC3978131.1 sensor histidine kinase [Amycolatopsis sp. H20-H5]